MFVQKERFTKSRRDRHRFPVSHRHEQNAERANEEEKLHGTRSVRDHLICSQEPPPEDRLR